MATNKRTTRAKKIVVRRHDRAPLLPLSIIIIIICALEFRNCIQGKKAMEDEDANFVFKFSLAKTGIVHSSTGLRLGDKE
jgi:hypothetical protein